MIQYIKIEDVEHPFLYSLRASVEGGKVDVKKLDVYEVTVKQLYIGFKYGAIYEDKKFPYTEKEFFKLIEIMPDIFYDASKVFEEQIVKVTGGMVAKEKLE